MIRRLLVLLFGVFSYLAFLATFTYAIGFVGNLVVPRSIDSPASGPFLPSLLVNLALLGLFAVQHSVMARPSFKRRWTQVIPPAIERSTYVLAASAALALMFWQWRPLGGVVWDVANPAVRTALVTVCAGGWLTVFVATLLIDHFELFGIRQVWSYFRGRAHQPPCFGTPGFYRFVRHPLYVGFLLAFWATPVMTVAHLVFAVATTGYILVAIQLEERNLMEVHPEYAQYRRHVPMLLPRLGRPRPAAPEPVRTAQ